MPDLELTGRLSPEPFRLDRERQAAPQIFAALRRRIVLLDLPPGTVLSRTALIEQFGTSQTPIRDALLRLADENLVDIFAQHATIVSRIDVVQARQAHYLRLAVELEVVRQLSATENRSFAGPIRRDIEHQKKMIEAGDSAGVIENDLGFHKRLCDAAGIPELWLLVRSRSGHLDRLRRLHFPEPGQGLTDHSNILSAVEAGDAAEAQKLMRLHLSRTLSLLETIRERYPDFLVS